MQVVALAHLRRPFVADDRAEPARFIGLFSGSNDVLPGIAVKLGAGLRHDLDREASVREGGDDLYGRLGALAGLHQIIPGLCLGIGEDVGIAGGKLAEEPHVVRVIGHNGEIQRARDADGLAGVRHNLLPLGEAIAVAWSQARAEGARIEGQRRMQVGFPEQRSVRKVTPGIGRIGRLLVQRLKVGRIMAMRVGNTLLREGRQCRWADSDRGEEQRLEKARFHDRLLDSFV